MKNLYWVEAAIKNTLTARFMVTPFDQTKPTMYVGADEKSMDAVQQWCEQNNCGIRTSFDTFKFKNRSEITMFLLRWSS